MIRDLSLDDFLAKNRIDEETWEKANIEWTTLQAIAIDHEVQSEQLGESAALLAKVIQKFEKVHSVRWRVKDSEHLLEKIVRKRAAGNTKYADIAPDNYFERVTDIVGIRALHLFKEDCLEIDIALKSLWSPIETPVVYKRAGDNNELSKKFEEKGFEIKDHPVGYRSVHYVIESRPLNRQVITEVQVRTIFEEGWSEIDHKIRYPNFSENELVGYFLGIFNRMAGSADEMGGFVRGLAATIKYFEAQVAAAKEENKATLRDMEQALGQLESVKEQDKTSKASIAKLKMEVAKLKEANNVETRSSIRSSQDILGGTSFFGSSALEQATRGILGTSSSALAASSLSGYSAAERAARGIMGANASSLLAGNLSGYVATEQAARDVLGASASALTASSLSEYSAAEQAARGILGVSLNVA